MLNRFRLGRPLRQPVEAMLAVTQNPIAAWATRVRAAFRVRADRLVIVASFRRWRNGVVEMVPVRWID